VKQGWREREPVSSGGIYIRGGGIGTDCDIMYEKV